MAGEDPGKPTPRGSFPWLVALAMAGLLGGMDLLVWARTGLRPGPGVVTTVAGVFRSTDEVPRTVREEEEKLYGPPPPEAGETPR